MVQGINTAMDMEDLKKQLEKLEKKSRRTELLLSVNRKVSGLTDLNAILFNIIDELVSELGAERGSLFLNDTSTNELYSRVAQGESTREIRFLNTSGIAGSIFHSKKGEIIHDVTIDQRFNKSIDEQTGFTTRSIICMPISTAQSGVIGVVQVLNKKRGRFTKSDFEMVHAITEQASATLQNAQVLEKQALAREKEKLFIDLVSDVTAEIELGSLLQRVMVEATKMLNADRATLFLHDPKTSELFSRIAMGDNVGEIRLPDNVGIAGSVFQSKETVNIPHAYADLRFNPTFDKNSFASKFKLSHCSFCSFDNSGTSS